jgi:hypothetical protein
MPKSKEKRTKEQVLHLLDRAMEQEESLLEKVKTLEGELTLCRKKAENPRHELEERALPKSKVSFRLDYYRTEEKGPLKGIIEHLPTRETCSFEGDGLDGISGFIAQFVGQTTWRNANSDGTGASNKVSTVQKVSDKKKLLLPLPKKPSPESTLPPTAEPPLTETTEPQDDYPFLILTAGRPRHARSVHQAQPFEIEIPMHGYKGLQDKPCNLKILATTSGNSSTHVFEMREYCVPTRTALRIPVPEHPLEPGVYQLWVSLGLCEEPQKPGYQKSRLLIVQ